MMEVICVTTLGQDGFAERAFTATASKARWALTPGQDAPCRVVYGKSLLVPKVAVARYDVPLRVGVWHLPGDEQIARKLLVDHLRNQLDVARHRIDSMLDTAARMQGVVDGLE